MTQFKKVTLPDYFIVPYSDHYDTLEDDFNFFESFGIDCGLFFDEVITLVYNNYGTRPSHGDFDDIDYVWISLAYDTYSTIAKHTPDFASDDIETFHLMYAAIVEMIYLAIYPEIETIMTRYGASTTFNIHFVSFIHRDLLLKVERH